MGLMGPGPDFSVVMKNSLANGRKAGVLTALGIGSGMVIHISYCVLGLGFLLGQDSPVIFWIRILGCICLIYLGIRCLTSKPPDPEAAGEKMKTNRSCYYQGLITNLLNPNAVLFFISLFSTLISQNPMFIVCMVGLTMILVAVIWFSFVSYLFSFHVMNKAFMQNANLVNRALGVILIAFGIRILLL